MTEKIFKPLRQIKPAAKLCLYSLKGWDFQMPVTKIPKEAFRLGEVINSIDKTAIECFFASSFFNYCTEVPQDSDLYKFIQIELPKKDWLRELSAKEKERGLKVSGLFEEKKCLFDCIKDLDANRAYSFIQYIEGYYLVRESVNRGLLKGQNVIDIAFVLPNDEGKYYQDFPNDVKQMLQLDFGKRLTDIKITITFEFFLYEKPDSRPYNGNGKVTPKNIGSYFEYLNKPATNSKGGF